ncbi:MAG: ATP-binding cassette domain-containing protein [Saprospiraceae bacterium]
MSESQIQVRIDSIKSPNDEHLVGGIDFIWREGGIIALTGSSGAGKTLICKSIVGILPAQLKFIGSTVYRHDREELDLARLPESQRTEWNAGQLAYLTQETDLALNPIRKIGKSFRDAMRLARSKVDRQAMQSWLRKVDLPADVLERFPHELSGGQIQRVLLAIVLASGTRWLIADEPTSNLDKVSQQKIVDLLSALNQELGLGILLVTHDTTLWKRLTNHVIEVSPGSEQVSSLQPVENFSEEKVMEISDVSFAYRKHWWGKKVPVLNQVNLAISEGDWVGLIGASGSGKSTLAKLMTQLVPLQDGQISYRNRPLQRLTMRYQSREIQMVFQNPYTSLNPRLTIRSQLQDAVPSVDWSTQPWKPLLKAFQLGDLDLDRMPATYSGGERQRLAIIRALLKHPKLLVCDEAISSLDPHNQWQTLRILQEISASGRMGLLFISHDITWIRQVCHKIYVMDQGHIIESGPTSRIIAQPAHPVTQALIAAAMPW